MTVAGMEEVVLVVQANYLDGPRPVRRLFVKAPQPPCDCSEPRRTIPTTSQLGTYG
jgi:hypothetical protein